MVGLKQNGIHQVGHIIKIKCKDTDKKVKMIMLSFSLLSCISLPSQTIPKTFHFKSSLTSLTVSSVNSASKFFQIL